MSIIPKALCAALFLGLAGWRTPPAFSQQPDFSVNVDRVVLHVTVEDRHGGFVTGLDRGDFHVYEDGVAQPVEHFHHEDLPVTVGLVVDSSTSMRPKDTDVEAAAVAFAHSSNPDDEMFVILFNEDVMVGLPPTILFTSSTVALESAMGRFTARGLTALYDGIDAGLDYLSRGSRDKKVLIVVSDGGDNASRHTLADVLGRAARSNVIIYTIGLYDELDRDRNPKVLKRLAEMTGGEFFQPTETKDVVGVCRRIAADIRHQYTITYSPLNRKQDGTYRTIRVTVTDPEHRRLEVRTRTGYRAPGKPGS